MGWLALGLKLGLPWSSHRVLGWRVARTEPGWLLLGAAPGSGSAASCYSAANPTGFCSRRWSSGPTRPPVQRGEGSQTPISTSFGRSSRTPPAASSRRGWRSFVIGESFVARTGCPLAQFLEDMRYANRGSRHARAASPFQLELHGLSPRPRFVSAARPRPCRRFARHGIAVRIGRLSVVPDEGLPVFMASAFDRLSNFLTSKRRRFSLLLTCSFTAQRGTAAIGRGCP